MRRRSRLSLPLVAVGLSAAMAIAWELSAPSEPVRAAIVNDADLAGGVRLVGPEDEGAQEAASAPEAMESRATAPKTLRTAKPAQVAAARAPRPAPALSDDGDLTAVDAEAPRQGAPDRPSGTAGQEVASDRAGLLLGGTQPEAQGPVATFPLSLPGADALPHGWHALTWSASAGSRLASARWTSIALEDLTSVWEPLATLPLQGGQTALLPDARPRLILVEAEGHAPRVVSPEASDALRPQRVALETGAALLVQARGQADLRIEVDLDQLGTLDPELACLHRVAWTRSTTPDGWLRMEGLPAGVPLHLSLEPRATGLPAVVELEAGEVRLLDLAPMDGPHALSGRLTDFTDAPLARRELWLVPAAHADRVLLAPEVTPARRLVTDADGSFHMEGLPRASWWLAPAPGSGLLEETHWFACLPEQREVTLHLSARPARSSRVVVRDTAGAPVADALVRVEDAHGQLMALRRSGPDGTVAMHAPEGEGAWVQALATPVCGRSPRRALRGGETCDLPVARGHAVQVLVHGPGGRVIPGPFEVTVTAPDGSVRAERHERPLISLRLEAEGPHSVLVRDGQGRLALAGFEGGPRPAGPRPVELRAAAGVELHNPQGVPLRWTLRQGGAAIEAGFLHAGGSVRARAQAGEAALEITAPGVARPLEQTLTLEDGSAHELGLPR
ncbi:MAG: hypothetical protein O2799_06835 [Planctomycetota bacterium]|nr:hypothetical protein [Planctomycetota bacterium]